MKVKCIEDVVCGCINCNGDLELLVGQVYDVIEENYACYIIHSRRHARGGWFKERFEVVDETTATIQQIMYGAACVRCGEYNNYVEANSHFVCYGCRRTRA